MSGSVTLHKCTCTILGSKLWPAMDTNVRCLHMSKDECCATPAERSDSINSHLPPTKSRILSTAQFEGIDENETTSYPEGDSLQ